MKLKHLLLVLAVASVSQFIKASDGPPILQGIAFSYTKIDLSGKESDFSAVVYESGKSNPKITVKKEIQVFKDHVILRSIDPDLIEYIPMDRIYDIQLITEKEFERIKKIAEETEK